ncbi:L,D-transpeptidase family protein [Azospirillum rugosum]|uniref:L,D-peptidoglycan transpeptidase YkuD (ErfK/YbiS/YcfS/YnhG family) n=1 Tax=Azospirillum rugosum TaxID=416170 RepID=A0ABS4SMV9_9PROT|nr:L,D-transpeptidase family protein [Azospirillum rugosum]MBP2293897.1 L,D-peptidoglycan transpeptidase YkuD (ErfK/YbiS/YcfS/YnhG family) [Azospirillum rugosum]MDQ0526916.1 L,D-peptidoglycan transpeptidase YkuD (ErfK/YbiS/YcfS/YnhG family) [Azospirillum rugosum]
MDIIVHSDGQLSWPGGSFRCALGRGGVKADKREGDGATPVGRFPLRHVLWRADRLPRPETALPTDPIAPDDGWCDDPADPAYNRPVKRPFAASHEELWRADGVYDVIVVMGHNDDPVVPGQGSAVFMHVARPDWEPTAGCVALPLPDLLRLLKDCGPDTSLTVLAP